MKRVISLESALSESEIFSIFPPGVFGNYGDFITSLEISYARFVRMP
jgi:hypothetical protein